MTSSAARVVEVTTAAPRTQGVVVSQSQVCLRRWLRSIETVDNWRENVQHLMLSEMEAAPQNNNRLNQLQGVIDRWKIWVQASGGHS